MKGQQSFFDGNEPLKIAKPIRLIELFAGIGSQAAALRNLGVPFEHYRICEFDKYSVKSYNAVHGTDFETSDITQITAHDLGITSTDKFTYIMTYSFPCTDLSKAGKQQGMSRGGGTRSGLLWQVERLLSEMDELPQILLMENVPDVLSPKFISDFADWMAFLDSKGYTSKYKTLNSTGFNVPQNRERCFMVSWLGDYYYDFPEEQPLTSRLKDVLEHEVDSGYYLSEQKTQELIENMVLVNNGSVSKTIRTSGRRSFDRHTWDLICEDSGVYTGCSLSFTRLPLSGVSRALKATQHDSAVMFFEENAIRFYTPRECWRLMGFHDTDFDKAEQVNSNSQLYKQAGNSIVVDVLMAIFKEML